jgi:hypothetical protein
MSIWLWLPIGCWVHEHMAVVANRVLHNIMVMVANIMRVLGA